MLSDWLRSLIIYFQTNGFSILFRLILLGIVLALISPVSRWMERLIQAFFTRHGAKGGKPPADPQHAATVGSMLGSIARFLVWVLGAGICLGILGLNQAVTSLITAAGIGGLAVGFGAQKIIQDVFSGLSILMDRPFSVGDLVRIGPVTGTVRTIRMRTLVVESPDGETHVIPNGSIGTVTNLSGTFGLAVVEITVGIDKDYDAVRVLLEESANLAASGSDDAIDEPFVLGVTAVTPSTMTFRTECRTKPVRQLQAERTIRAAQLTSLKENGYF